MPRFQPMMLAVLLAASLLSTSASAQDAPAPAPEVPSKTRATAETHYQTAVSLFGEGRYREALDEFDAAIAASPESIFYCNRAIALIKIQEPEAALESLETCQSTHSGDDSELASIDAQRAGVSVLVHHVQPSVHATVSAINAPTLDRRRWRSAGFGGDLRFPEPGASRRSGSAVEVVARRNGGDRRRARTVR
jgi:tetratricopeptide (TPR) repeat protein